RGRLQQQDYDAGGKQRQEDRHGRHGRRPDEAVQQPRERRQQRQSVRNGDRAAQQRQERSERHSGIGKRQPPYAQSRGSGAGRHFVQFQRVGVFQQRFERFDVVHGPRVVHGVLH